MKDSIRDHIEIVVVPDMDTLRESPVYDEYDSDNCDELGYEQGLAADTVDIEDDGTFEIPKGYIGQLELDYTFFEQLQIKEEIFERAKEDFKPGRYKIEEDFTIKKVR